MTFGPDQLSVARKPGFFARGKNRGGGGGRSDDFFEAIYGTAFHIHTKKRADGEGFSARREQRVCLLRRFHIACEQNYAGGLPLFKHVLEIGLKRSCFKAHDKKLADLLAKRSEIHEGMIVKQLQAVSSKLQVRAVYIGTTMPIASG